jgi:spermidine/putrescine transport system permease protein
MARIRILQGVSSATILTAYALALYIFIYVPVAAMFAMSFNNSISPTLPWEGFTSKWYRQTLHNGQLFNALWNSARLGALVAILSTVVALLAALAFRRPLAGKAVILNMILVPLLIPGIVIGVGQAVLWNLLGLPFSLWGSTLVGHLVYAIPFAFITIYPRLYKFDPNIEAAAMDLGAGPWDTFWSIVFPRIAPGVVASMLFAFTLSFGEFIRTLFLIGAQNTLPMYLWSIILTAASPEANAIAVVVVALSLAVVLIALIVAGRGFREDRRVWRNTTDAGA